MLIYFGKQKLFRIFALWIKKKIMIQDIINMYNEGWNIEEISDELGIDECYIIEILEGESLWNNKILPKRA